MYRGFNLSLNKTEKQKFMHVIDLEVKEFDNKLNEQKDLLKFKMENTLDTSIDKEGNIDGSELTDEWFPNINADVLISHSHDDLRTVQRLAIWLEKTFDLITFVDSSVWGSANELLKEIDDKYSVLRKEKNETTYNYEIRNYTTAHVHMMLSTALMEMIDTTECLMFLNTPNSVKLNDYKERKTKSPWIYSELKVATVVEKKQPKRYLNPRYNEILHSDRTLKNYTFPEIDYDVSKELLKFNHLTRENLINWEENYEEIINTNEVHALDVLYLDKPLKI